MASILLIRHAQSAPSADVAEPDWPLSDLGESQAETLVSHLSDHPIDAIYASPYQRARATVTPLASERGHTVGIQDDLRERTLADGPLPDWRDQLARTWADFDYRLPGGESSRQCQQRVVPCLTALAESHRGESIVVCSHGNAIALFLNSIDAGFGFDAWSAMPNPALYHARYDGEWWLGESS